MASTDLTRINGYSQKKNITVFAGVVIEGADAKQGEIPAASGNYVLAKLPPDAVITNAFVHVLTASDAATSAVATLGTAEAGSEILSAANLAAVGETGTFTGQSLTTTGVDVYFGITITGAATTVGEYLVEIEYLEYTLNTGDYTRFN